MLFPFIYVVGVSFSSYRDVVGGGIVVYPANPTLDAYRTVFDGGVVVRALQVSLLVTTIGTFLNVFFTVSLAYALSRPGVFGSRFVLYLVLFTMLFWPGMIPMYLVVKETGPLNTYGTLILPGLINAFNLVVRNFLMNLPQELLDSARVDGAGDLRVLWDITLPLSKAVIAVIALFYGVAHWNEWFAGTLYLSDSSRWPIQVVLRQYVLQGNMLSSFVADHNRPPPPLQTVRMAVVVIANVPILLVYPFLQRYFAPGGCSRAPSRDERPPQVEPTEGDAMIGRQPP